MCDSESTHKRLREDDVDLEAVKATKTEDYTSDEPDKTKLEKDVKEEEEEDLGDLPDWFTPLLKEKISYIYSKGQVTRNDLDKNVLESMRDFTPAVQVEILEKYAETDLNGIRSKTAFLVGILKRYRARPENMACNARPSGMGGTGMMPMGMGTGMTYPPLGSHALQTAFLQASGVKREELADSTKDLLNTLYETGKAKESDFGPNVIKQLKALDEEGANEAIGKLSEADTSTIRNKAGFFMGIMRRVQEQHMPQGVQANLAAFNHLPYSVQMRLAPLYQAGLLAQNDLEAKVIQSLGQFSEPVANDIVAKFCESDLTKVTNKSGWLVGIIKRFRAQGATSTPGQSHHQYAPYPPPPPMQQYPQTSYPPQYPPAQYPPPAMYAPPPPTAAPPPMPYQPSGYSAPIASPPLSSTPTNYSFPPAPAAPAPATYGSYGSSPYGTYGYY